MEGRGESDGVACHNQTNFFCPSHIFAHRQNSLSRVATGKFVRNMADKQQSSRYKPLNSKIPVLSKNYKSILRDLKSKKDQIENENVELDILKQDLIALKSKASSSTASTKTTTASCSTRQAFSPEEVPVHRAKSDLRTTITTPKGTKRKGKL